MAATLCGCGSGFAPLAYPTPPLASHPQVTFVVSPQGNDADPGTLTQPFATLARAQGAVRAINGSMQGDIVVYLRAGVYPLSQTWTLDQRDSGANGSRVIWAGYPGEQVSLSGGSRIANWTQDAAGRWTAATSLDNFRNLYVNGIRATRGRSGPLTSPTVFGDPDHVAGVAGFDTLDPQIATWKNPRDVELGFFYTWTHMICGVKAISALPTGASLTVNQPCFYLIRNKVGTQAGFPAYAENALELTTSPGQFYLDRAQHTVFYLPRPGEDMHTADVIAPTLQTLMTVTGTLNTPATSIAFTNITFEHSSWLLPSQFGLPEVQASFFMAQDLSQMYTDISGNQRDVSNQFQKTPGAVVLTYAHNVTFERCTFQHLGGSGVDLQLGSQNDILSGGTFTDISANAIQVGDVQHNDHHPTDPRMILHNNSVTNSYLHDVGIEYTGSVAIFVGYTDSTTIAHNEITRAPYTAVSVGWGWGMEDPGYTDAATPETFTTPTPSQQNLITFNHIHDIQQRGADGGGVYTSGAMPGTQITSNLVHDNPQPPGGIYLDTASRGITVTTNVVFGEQLWYGGFLAPIYTNLAPTDLATDTVYANLLDNPTAASTLAGEAGLQPAYLDLLK